VDARRWAVRGGLAPLVLVLAIVSALVVDEPGRIAFASIDAHAATGHARHPGTGSDGHRIASSDPCAGQATAAAPSKRASARVSTRRRAPQAVARSTASMMACVPAVAFQARAILVRGRIRTAFLINVAAEPGSATLVGVARCSVQGRPGVPAWLDCAYPCRAQQVTVQVRLPRHRIFTATIPVVAPAPPVGRRSPVAVSPPRRRG